MADWGVFLDRDGLINELVEDSVSGLPESPSLPEEVRLAPDAVEAIRKLRGLGVPLIVVSNQPNAAKGKNTLAELEAVHATVVRLLDEAGATIDDFRYCYHHPDGTDPELGRACPCRKPEPGLILEASDGLDLAQSWMVGDSDVDIEAGERAGCRTILVEVPGSAHRRKGNVKPDFRAATFREAADIIDAQCSTS